MKMMLWVAGTLTIVVMAFVTPILSTLFGAFGGWVVGLVFGDTILSFMAALGIEGFTMWQLGAAMGFVGAFFRSHHIDTRK